MVTQARTFLTYVNVRFIFAFSREHRNCFKDSERNCWCDIYVFYTMHCYLSDTLCRGHTTDLQTFCRQMIIHVCTKVWR